MKPSYYILLILLIQPGFEESARSETPLFHDTFDSESLSESWIVNFGEWSVDGEHLDIRKQEAENHGASGRYPLDFRNAEIFVRFKLNEGSSGFTLSFDPDPDHTEKVGALHSILIRPHIWRIQRGASKKNLKNEPAVFLAEAKIQLVRGTWYDLRVILQGQRVVAAINDVSQIKADDSQFGIGKSAVVFKTPDKITIDQLKVTLL